ncbi:unnamed protein product [Meloidogyne enterolobii]|uniref:Uncharacterized protein n=1 Tax=Meloidogyne enterolobii TaxID=390850 RepID=A0ACB0ZDN2_MELEN
MHTFKCFVKPASDRRLVVRPNLSRLVCRSGADDARVLSCSLTLFWVKFIEFRFRE